MLIKSTAMSRNKIGSLAQLQLCSGDQCGVQDLRPSTRSEYALRIHFTIKHKPMSFSYTNWIRGGFVENIKKFDFGPTLDELRD